MEKMVIEGGARLKGTVHVNGAKNAALPMMAASLLAEGPSVLRNVPDLRDIHSMMALLGDLGAKAERSSAGNVRIEVNDKSRSVAPYEQVSTMRGSVCVLGPLLAKRGYAEVSLPGGCSIGVRPIDLHIKGLRALGAKIAIRNGYIIAEADELRGAEVYLGGAFGPTVLGTANIMMAATLAKGTTVVECAACEPEVVDLAAFLTKMGADIRGAGSPVITINGVDQLFGATHKLIPDRIEAATFMAAGAITHGDVTVDGVRGAHVGAVVDVLTQIGANVERRNGSCRVWSDEAHRAVDVSTYPYPGVPTDVQAQIMAMLAVARGISVVTDKVFPERFMHVAELNRMGANIRKEGPSAIINGVRKLSGAPVMASDLRASAALILAGLIADGTTEVHRVYHLDRGYERIEERLVELGAKIERVAE